MSMKWKYLGHKNSKRNKNNAGQQEVFSVKAQKLFGTEW